jgi:hypothetical protein
MIRRSRSPRHRARGHEPTADVTCAQRLRVRRTGPVTAAPHTFKVTNTGPQPPGIEFFASRGQDDEGRPRRIHGGGVDRIRPGPPPFDLRRHLGQAPQVAYFTSNLTPGKYVCSASSRRKGREGAPRAGMVRASSVVASTRAAMRAASRIRPSRCAFALFAAAAARRPSPFSIGSATAAQIRPRTAHRGPAGSARSTCRA